MHTKRSPSQAKKFGACNGTLALCEALPEEQRGKSGEAARIGTCVHKLIEHTLRLGEEPSAYLGRIVEITNEGEDDEDAVILKKNAKTPGNGRVWYEIDSAMIDGAEMMTNYVRERCAELGVEESALELETRTNPLPDRDDTSGTADVTINAWPALLEVADYKNGYLEVDHKDNDQLLAYLLGKALEAGMTHEKYRVTVIQPNCEHEDGRIRFVEATKKELLAFQKRYAKTIAKCEEAEDAVGAPTKDGSAIGFHFTEEWANKYLAAGDHCTFCDAKAVCPAFIAARQREAATDFADEPAEQPEPRTDEAVTRILAWAPHMESLIEAARVWAFRSAEKGNRVPGWKLVRGRSNREYTEPDEETRAKAIVKAGFLTEEELFKRVMITGPAAEKLVGAKLPKKERGAARKAFDAAFMTKPEGALKLAPIDDPREEVVVNVADDFADADEFDFG